MLSLAPFCVMGVVNATPDSFHDGGRHQAPAAARASALAWAEACAAKDIPLILDVGGESTRPGAEPVAEAEELARVLPVVAALDGVAPVSIDTTKAAVAAAALKAGGGAGAVIVNDVSAARWDPAMPDLLAAEKPGYILMHSGGRPGDMQTDPHYTDVVAEILDFFEERMAALTAAGLPEDHIALDPGVGFGKTLSHNLAVLKGLERFTALGRPLVLGLSHKSLFGRLLGLGPGERGGATLAATALAAARGARVHRVHDVAEAAAVLRLTAALE